MFVQKKSEARLIDCQGAALVQTILKNWLFNIEKAKNQKNLDVDLSWFVRSINVAIHKILYQNKFDSMNAYLLLYQQQQKKIQKK